MKHALHFSVLLSILLSGACMAAEPTVCTAICTEEKRECRAGALHRSGLDHAPMIANAESANRDARALGKLQGSSQEARAGERSDFQKRKSEREHACDSRAMACARACASPEPSTIVKPKTQQ